LKVSFFPGYNIGVASLDLVDIEPFEICSIRPPTENYSLTFRLTRNCYWNKCAFCPAYKSGSLFSRRSLEEVIRDIGRARQIDDLLSCHSIGTSYSSGDDYDRVRRLTEQVCDAKRVAPRVGGEGLEREGSKTGFNERPSWFLPWFSENPSIEESIHHIFTWRMAGGETCFLGDSDSLILKREFLAPVIERAKLSFPTLKRFTVYGRTKSARSKSLKELEDFRAAGLHRVHFGLESGSDEVLRIVSKGATSEDHVEGCLKVKEAGLSCSVYVMPGLGGTEFSEEHARETARVINAIGPDFVRLRTLEIFPHTPLSEAMGKGAFAECSEEQAVKELKILIEEINVPTEILSDSASNLLDLFGSLPYDRIRLLETINRYLFLPGREKLIFSLSSRLHSFMGQYGRLSKDLNDALLPFARDKKIDPALAADEDLERIIRLIRSKLMP
jgi:hypothetical protein